jgi:hypothetical protein
MAHLFYIPSNSLLPFLRWLDYNSVKPLTLTDDELADQWATFCIITLEEGEG